MLPTMTLDNGGTAAHGIDNLLMLRGAATATHGWCRGDH